VGKVQLSPLPLPLSPGNGGEGKGEKNKKGNSYTINLLFEGKKWFNVRQVRY